MGSLTDLLQPGVAAGRLLLPSALLLGVLHGLEPEHSKTMMMAFIIAVRGTIGRAVLLGLAATVSHTAVVWVSAIIAMHFGSQYSGAVAEPYLQIASAALIIVVALWMLGCARREQLRLRTAGGRYAHHHSHGQHHALRDAHELAHADEIRRQFASRNVTTGQIVLFGLSGGLIPCSAAIAVLVLCLQINAIWLGVALVLCSSIGLAITLIAAGIIAAVGMRGLSRRWSGFGELVQRILPLRRRHDRHRPIYRLAGLGQRSRLSVARFGAVGSCGLSRNVLSRRTPGQCRRPVRRLPSKLCATRNARSAR